MLELELEVTGADFKGSSSLSVITSCLVPD